jgi:putative colanic acid biosynthesis acetyltransferase WcaF
MESTIVDLSLYNSKFSLSNKLGRFLWKICYWIFFRPFSLRIFNKWRRFILQIFGSKIAINAIIYSSAKIWAPWNLEMGEYSCLGPHVDCYNQGKITIGRHTIISQKVYLCASTHNYEAPDFPLICNPIKIEDQVWIAADAFIGPGVIVRNGAIVGARAAVFKDVEMMTVVGGNPAQFIKNRIFTKN